MSIDSEQLSVTLEARIADFERNFRKACSHGGSRVLADRKPGRRGVAAAGRLIVASRRRCEFSERRASWAYRRIYRRNADIQDGRVQSRIGAHGREREARRMSTDAFQKLTYAGDKFGVKPEAVASGAAALADKANQEARDGEGELTRLLETNNLKLTDRAGKVRDVNSLLMDAGRSIKNADSEFDKVDIARLFGPAGRLGAGARTGA